MIFIMNLRIVFAILFASFVLPITASFLLSENITILQHRAEQGISEAQYKLGVAYFWGRGVKEDYANAVVWLIKASEQGHSKAQNMLGMMYNMGWGVPQSYTKAVKYHRKAAIQGDSLSQYSLGEAYYYGRGVEKNYADAAEWYSLAATQGEKNAQYRLGRMYECGEGVQQSYTEAEKWYRLAAEQDHEKAKKALESIEAKKCQNQINKDAESYYFNYKVFKLVSFPMAMDYLIQSAELGYEEAMIELGAIYYSGTDDVPQDFTKAYKWFRILAEKGNTYGELSLGEMYEHGQGVPQSYTEAVKWYRRAMDQGHPQGRYLLALCMIEGKGGKKDVKGGIKLLEEGRAENHWPSIDYLREMGY